MYCTCCYDSPLGTIGLAATEDALVALWLPGQPPFAKAAHPLSDLAEHPVLARTKDWLDRYFAGEAPSCTELPLKPEGSPFRQVVWELLCAVPYGQTTTYGALAKEAADQLGKARMSAQAVGGAVGANPISIIIPCHRCLGAKSTLTGYAGGLHLKRALLDLEKIGYFE